MYNWKHCVGLTVRIEGPWVDEEWAYRDSRAKPIKLSWERRVFSMYRAKLASEVCDQGQLLNKVETSHQVITHILKPSPYH
jgi:hypothetical protein